MQGAQGNIYWASSAAGLSTTSNVTITGVLTYEDVTNIDSVGIITARDDVSIADKIIHTGDTDTAIRFPDADTITAETAGTEKLRITSAGKVGIGSAIPSNQLDVAGGVDVLGIYRDDYTGTGGAGLNLNFGGAKANGDLFNCAKITAIRGDNTAQTGEFRFSVLTGGTMSEKLRIQSTGSVGINTTVPSTAQYLTIDGESNYKAGIFYRQAGVDQYRFMCEGGTGHVYYDTFKDGGDHIFRTDAATTGGLSLIHISEPTRPY